jgi:hypothetical protein
VSDPGLCYDDDTHLPPRLSTTQFTLALFWQDKNSALFDKKV